MCHRRIIIESVDADKMRIFGQVGDWRYDDDGNLVIQVARRDIIPNVPGDVLSTELFLIALHELVEARLCLNDGVEQEAVDAFDSNFSGDGEPGDHEDSPYRDQHRRACLLEFMMADWLGITGYGVME